MLLWGSELVEQERQRAEQEKLRAEQEKQRAAQERQRAEQAELELEQEQIARQRLVQKLKELAVTSTLTLTEVLVYPLRSGNVELAGQYRDILLE